MCATSTSPGSAAEAVQQHGCAGGDGRRSVVERGDRAALQDPQGAVGVERPLDVLGCAVVLLDAHPQLGDGHDLTLIERRARPLLTGQLPRAGPALLVELDRELLVVDVAAPHVQRRGLLDEEAVGRDRTGDDRLAEPEGALDDELPVVARGGVGGEHDTGAGRRDLLLHDDGDVHLGLREPLRAAVVDGARAEQGAPAPAHRVEHGVRPDDVQERLVHAGERGGGRVLGGGGGAHGDRRARDARLRARLADLTREPFRHGGVVEEDASRGGGLLERRRVLDVDPVEQRGQLRPQAGLLAEGGVGGGADHEAGRDRETRGGQLTQIRALAAGVVDVAAAQIAEVANRLDG
jgi:hypothetical protein